jgi:hypothetical protein
MVLNALQHTVNAQGLIIANAYIGIDRSQCGAKAINVSSYSGERMLGVSDFGHTVHDAAAAAAAKQQGIGATQNLNPL